VTAPTTRHPGRLPKLGERVPAFARMAKEVSEHVACHGADRVAVVLRVMVADLEPMLAGRIGLSRASLRALRRLV
jgi:hypothetical protein